MYNGQTRGIKAEMYAINKQQQRREWQLLKHVYHVKFLPFTLPDPTNTKISVKKWDVLQEKCILQLGWTMEKFWIIGAGESEYQKKRFMALYTLLNSSSQLI